MVTAKKLGRHQLFENLRKRKIKEYKDKQDKKFEREERNQAYERAMRSVL